MQSSCWPALIIAIIAVLATAKVSVAARKPSVPVATPTSTSGPLDLDVVVSRRGGKPVAELQQKDFTVYLNGTPQPITSFRAVETTAAAPVETIILIDDVNTRITGVGLERMAVDRFLKQNNGKLSQPITLVIMSETGIQITRHASRNGNQLAAFLDKASIGLRNVGHAAGFYGWTEEFQISASALERIAAQEQARPARKLLIWMSPGWPLLSGPEVELTYGQQKNLFSTLVALSASLRGGSHHPIQR